MTTLFKAIVGSQLHRTNTEASDTDVRSVHRLSLEERLSPFTNEKAKQEQGDEHDNVSYELSHFARLAAKNNPTIMEVLLSDKLSGDSGLASAILTAALDTELYFKHTNGMINGMVRKGTAKSLHHAERLKTHLLIYKTTGGLQFDASAYWNFDHLMRVKRGEHVPSMLILENVEMNQRWHIQNLDRLSRIVYNEYMKDTKLHD